MTIAVFEKKNWKWWKNLESPDIFLHVNTNYLFYKNPFDFMFHKFF